MSKKAMQQALDALNQVVRHNGTIGQKIENAKCALRAAIASNESTHDVQAPNGMLKDASSGISKSLACAPHARRHATEAAAAIAQKSELAAFEAWWDAERIRTWIAFGNGRVFGDEPSAAWLDHFKRHAFSAWKASAARVATEKPAPLTFDAAREIADQWYADDGTSAVELVRRTERAHGIGIDGGD